MDSYEEMIIPEVPKALPNEQLFIYAPIASDDTLGVAKFDNEYFSVDVDGTVHLRSVGRSGIITIPASEWTDAAPTIASVAVSGVDVGSIILMLPADEKTRLTANNAKLSAYPTAFTPAFGNSSVTIFRAEAETIPDSDMTFAYIVLKTGFTFKTPVAAIIGVDAYGEGGGTGGSVDSAAVEEIVTRLVPGWARESIPPAETDPTISDWAKAKYKPTYSKDEVGLGNVDNVKQYSASNPPPYPVTSVNSKTGAVSLTAGDVGARPVSWTPTAADVGADKSGTAASKVTEHNTSTASHTDLRAEIKTLADRLAAVLDSDDTTLDELSEIVAYIKSNKTLIDAITTSKVGVTDIIDDLTTNVTNKPLSAAQGVALKALIDGLQSGKLNATDLISAINTALAQAKASGEFDGKDGVSATHSWNGTTLIVTSASGTSSANLKGDPGKSAYEYAKDGGYEGTEEEFAKKLAEDIFSKDTSEWSPVEYMGGAAWTELGYYWKADGTHTNTQYTADYRSTAELIKIEPNCAYTLSAINGVYFLYDASGKNGVQSAIHTTPNVPITFETNDNQHYIGISHKPTSSFPVTRVSLVRNTISEAEYDALPTKADTLKTMYGKTVVCFGDSLFGMYRGDTSTPAYIAKHTGATVHNCGFGGCRMSVHPTSGYAAFSMWALAKAIAENDWTTQDAQASSGSSYFSEHLALLKSIDFNSVDVVVIHYGTNDFGAGGDGIALDNPDSAEDYTTLCGALRYSINKLLTAYPKLRIYISLPVYRYWTDGGLNTYAEDYKKNGYTLSDFVEVLRNVAAEFNLPVIDGYYGLGVNRYNASAYLGDGTHHNEIGRKLFGEYIGANLIAQQTSGKIGVDMKAINALIENAIGSAIGGAY